MQPETHESETDSKLIAQSKKSSINNLSLVKTPMSIFMPITEETNNGDSLTEQTSDASEKLASPKKTQKRNGFYLETIDRLVDSNGKIIAKNETVKYLGTSSDNEKSKRFSLAAALINQEKDEAIPSSGSAPSSPLQTKRENFSIKVPGINKKSLKELDKDELEEIAYVIRHHEKNNSRPYKNNYFFNNEEIYPDGPLRNFLDSIKDEDMAKFDIESLKKEKVANEVKEKKTKKEELVAIREADDSLVKRVRLINIPKRTLNSNQHFMVDIDNDTVLASDLSKSDLEKVVAAIESHRPKIRTKTSRYFLNSQEILPRGILRKYFKEYDEEDSNETANNTQFNQNMNKNLKPLEIEAPLRVKIMNKPGRGITQGENDNKDFLCFLVGEGDDKRFLRELNENEINRILAAIGKHWPDTRTEESRFFFHNSQIYPNVVETDELIEKKEKKLKAMSEIKQREPLTLNEYQFNDDADKSMLNQIYLELDNSISKPS
jgi:hypothetical protein